MLARQPYHILLLTIRYRLVSELFDGNENPHTIADFLDPHLLKDFLITFNEVIAIEIICWIPLVPLLVYIGNTVVPLNKYSYWPQLMLWSQEITCFSSQELF